MLTALSTMAQNNSRIEMMTGDSGTRDGSQVPDGTETSILKRWLDVEEGRLTVG